MSAHVAHQVGERFRALGSGGLTRGSVHSVFTHAANIEVGDELYTVSVNHGCSQRSINITGQDLAGLPLEAGQPCLFAPDGFTMGSVYIDLSRALSWQPCLRLDMRQTPTAQTIATYLVALRHLCPDAGRHEHIDESLIQRLAYEQTAEAAATSLIGLGPGLTPAGDDMVLGALAAANHLLGTDTLARQLAVALIKRRTATTIFSAQMLTDALKAEYCEQLDTLVYALAKDRRATIERDLKNLLAVGASSGADMAAGIAVVLHSCLRPTKPTRSKMRDPEKLQEQVSQQRTSLLCQK